MLKHNMYISYEAGTHNIVYLEGVSSNFTVNKDEPNEFNDLRCLLSFKQGVPVITNYWVATTEPGKYYTENPMNPKGAARIQFGQYTAWRVGVHGKDRHRALVQVNPITVCRDVNKDYARARDIEDTGLFGVNQHGGYDQPEKNIGRASAGCLVGRSMKEHQEFMRIITKDPRYIADAKFIWPTAICAGNQV
jgi:hypothetical protein